MILDVLTLEDVEQVRLWRNQLLETLRTPHLLSKEMQAKFYYRLANESRLRYWAIREEKRDYTFTGMGGLTDISPENRNAEITLTIDPDLVGKGYGEEAVELLYDQAFNYMNLENVYGEVYWCNEKGVNFWDKIVEKYCGRRVILPNRKYWKGQYYDSDYFNITREGFNGKMQDMRDTAHTSDNDVEGIDMSGVS